MKMRYSKEVKSRPEPVEVPNNVFLLNMEYGGLDDEVVKVPSLYKVFR